MKSELGIGDFSPASQDKFVIWLIDNRGALIQVANGLIRNAVLKTNGEWASLPESPYGQPAQTMQGALDVFKKAISNEIKGESEIATPKGQLDETIKKLK